MQANIHYSIQHEPIDVVLLHGWGVNSAVWQAMINAFNQQQPAVRFHALDIPGYGQSSKQTSSANLSELANLCLQQAPPHAIWVGWSLGGMIAMQAAVIDSKKVDNKQRILGLQLISSTPKFVQADDWRHGVDLSVFQSFCDDLAADYQRTLNTFLLLQAGSNTGARALARQAANAINIYSPPTAKTLQQGIDCLADSDLRTQLIDIVLPSQVVCGALDRVTKPQASYYLAQQLNAQLIELKTGHAPFLNQPQQYIETLSNLIMTVQSGDDIEAIK